MPDIFLEEWAANRRVKQRTAQTWAGEKKIPAKLKWVTVTVKRRIKKYVIDEHAKVPA